MRFLLVVSIVAALLASPTWAQRSPEKSRPSSRKLNFDLFKINGMPVCLSKGRFQDHQSKVMEQIIAARKDAIPVLIEMITDETTKKDGEPVICFWYPTVKGDLAYFVLADLFLDPTWQHSSIPAFIDEEIETKHKDSPSWTKWDAYVEKYGRKGLQAHWKKVWVEYKDRVEWDPVGRYFKLKNDPAKPGPLLAPNQSDV